MEKPSNYDSAKAETRGEFKKIPAGGHILGIVGVENGKTSAQSKGGVRNQLILSLDIAEGEFKNEYRKMTEKFGKPCYLKSYLPYEGTDVPFFKGAITSIEKTNGFLWNWDERTLVGKKVGANLREKEYINKNGELKTILEVAYLCSSDTIKEGVAVLPVKTATQAPAQSHATTADSFANGFNNDDLPF